MQYPKTHPMNMISKLLMNSLYGKFGMSPYQSIIEIADLEDPKYRDIFLPNDVASTFDLETLEDCVRISDRYLILVRKNMSKYVHEEDSGLLHGVDINVAISSTITTGGRLWMSRYKNNNSFNLYYSDTDSIVVDRPLNEDQVGSALGQFKLEHQISRAVFLSPKVYGFLDSNDIEHIKVKGVKSENLINFRLQDLANLLVEDSTMIFSQEKWFKKVLSGDITTGQVAYHLKATSNKRKNLFINVDDKSMFYSTRPYNYVELEKVS